MMKNDEENKNDAKAWGTWEELLLACAVKRHGFKNWESVAMELQTKTSLPHLLTTAQCCKQKYHDLKRRFKDVQQEHEHEHEPPAKLVNIPWLEELRKVRVDELKQEVQRYDLNILSLQLKVKRLEEEREPALDIKTTQQKPDLDDRNIGTKDEPEKSEEPEKVCKRLISGEESDRDNRSVNESNSTGLSEKVGDGEIIKNESKVVGSGGMGGSKAVESDELGDSVTQLSSDVQSSASFGRKRERSCGDSIKGTDVKSEPLMRLLELIRTQKHVSLFERRLKSQESNEYKEMVRQHVDLETIQTRVEQGTYASCILTFYRDVLLLFNNAIVYFSKSSLESSTAFQLRNLFSNEIKKDNHKSDSSQDPPPPPLPPPPASLLPQLKPRLERSDSLLAKHKQSSPIIFCRKRTAVSTKPSTSSTFARQQQADDNKPPAETKPSVERSSGSSLLKAKTQEKAVTTGARSSRRSNRNSTPNTDSTTTTPRNKKENATSGSGSVDKQATPKADKKKSEGSTTSDKKKSVVDFLKRIKKNSPVQTVKKSKGSEEPKKNNNNNNNNNNDNSSSSNCGKKEKGKEGALSRSDEKRQAAKEENRPSKRSVGRPPKKTPETSGKRGRESGGKETVVGKRQSKRARR